MCPKQEGLFADPGDCKKFYLCGSGHSWAQSCPPSLYFDDKLKFCTFKTPALTCGPVDEAQVDAEAAKEAESTLPYCDRTKCQLPNCWCSEDGTLVPGLLPPNQIPQMVLLSFSGAVNELVFDAYKKALGYGSKFNSGQSR